MDRRRETFRADLLDQAGYSLLSVIEELSPCAKSTLPLCLLDRGFDRTDGFPSFHSDFRQYLNRSLERFQRQGWVTIDSERIAITNAGKHALRTGAVGPSPSGQSLKKRHVVAFPHRQGESTGRPTALAEPLPLDQPRYDRSTGKDSDGLYEKIAALDPPGRVVSFDPAANQNSKREPMPKTSIAPASEPWCVSENLPRRMRLGVSQEVELRISRKLTADLIELGALVERFAPQAFPSPRSDPDVSSTVALALRLASPRGGLIIEAKSPETQWTGLNRRHTELRSAPWRFVVTPTKRGMTTLRLGFSWKQLNADGLLVETRMPELAYDIKVVRNMQRLGIRVLAWLVVLFAGMALGILATELPMLGWM